MDPEGLGLLDHACPHARRGLPFDLLGAHLFRILARALVVQVDVHLHVHLESGRREEKGE